MDVFNLAERKPGRMRPALLFRQRVADLVPRGLRRSQGMVPVPHRQQHRMLPKPGLQLRQRPVHLRQLLLRLHGVARQVPAAEHQLEVVQLPQGLLLRPQGLQNRPVRVVQQDHDVAQLQRRSPADLQPGRKALRDRLLRGPDQGQGSRRIVILLQIHRAYQTHPGSGGRFPLAKHVSVFDGRNQHAAIQILRHGAVNPRNPAVAFLQIAFRQHQPQRRRPAAHQLFRFFPVFRLGSILIAGYAGPGFRRNAFLWQQYFRGAEGLFFFWHGNPLFLSSVLKGYIILHEIAGKYNDLPAILRKWIF